MILVSSCICLCPIYWSRVLSREWRCSWSSADRRCSNYIWVINNLIAYKGAPYIRYLTVHYIHEYVLTICICYIPIEKNTFFKENFMVLKSSISPFRALALLKWEELIKELCYKYVALKVVNHKLDSVSLLHCLLKTYIARKCISYYNC